MVMRAFMQYALSPIIHTRQGGTETFSPCAQRSWHQVSITKVLEQRPSSKWERRDICRRRDTEVPPTLQRLCSGTVCPDSPQIIKQDFHVA